MAPPDEGGVKMEEEKPNPADYFCPHEDCSDYGVVGKGNITLSHRYGKQRKYLLWCKTCERTFSEKRGTIFYGLKGPPCPSLHRRGEQHRFNCQDNRVQGGYGPGLVEKGS
jgi:hypothetical protein